MSVRNRRRKRRDDGMNFAYAGPFAPLLDPTRTLPLTKERYTPDSPESYTIGSRVDIAKLYSIFDVQIRPKRRRRRGGARRVAA